MKVSVTVTKQDFWEINKYAMLRRPKFRRATWLNLIVFPLAAIALYKILGSSWPYSIAVGLVFGIAADLLMIYMTKRKVMRVIGDDHPVLGERTIEIGETGIYESSDKGEAQYAWQAVEEIKQDKKHMYIFIGQAQGLVVPKRYFASNEEAEQFMNQLQVYHRQAQQAS